MKKLYFFLLIVFVFQANNFAQDFWQASDFPSFYKGEIIAIDAKDNLIIASSYQDSLAISTNGGESWFSGNLPQICNSVAVSNSGRLFAISFNGVLYRSSDFGKTWEAIKHEIYNATISSDNSGNIYLCTFQDFYVSTNSGDTWIEKTNNGLFNQPGESPNHIAFNNKGIIIVAARSGLFKSTDIGDTWEKISNFSASNFAIDSYGYIYANKYKEEPYYYSPVLYRSTDSGVTWETLKDWHGLFIFVDQENNAIITDDFNYPNGYAISVDYGSTWSQVEIESSPKCITYNDKGTFYLGANGLGILKSTSLQGPWKLSVTNFPNAVSSVTSIVDHKNVFFAGTKSFGLYNSIDRGKIFSKMSPGTGTDAPITELTTVDNYMFFLYRTFLISTNDMGSSWKYYNYNIGEPLYNFAGAAICTIKNIIITGGSILSGGSEAQIYRSTDYGNTWNEVFNISIDNFLLPYKVVTLASDNKGVVLGVLEKTEDLHSHFPSYKKVYEILRSTDSGSSWNVINTGLPEIPRIIDFVWNSQNEIFALTTQGFIQSNDSGNTWFYPSGSVPTLKINCVVVDPLDNMYIGTDDKGIFISKDKGFSWKELNEGLSDTTVNTLYISSDGYLLAGTEHAGIFRSNEKVTSATEKISTPSHFALSQNYPNPFNPTTKFRFQISYFGLVTLEVFDLFGKEVATLVNEERPAGKYEVEFDGSKLSSGIYFYQLKAGNFVETKKLVLIK